MVLHYRKNNPLFLVNRGFEGLFSDDLVLKIKLLCEINCTGIEH